MSIVSKAVESCRAPPRALQHGEHQLMSSLLCHVAMLQIAIEVQVGAKAPLACKHSKCPRRVDFSPASELFWPSLSRQTASDVLQAAMRLKQMTAPLSDASAGRRPILHLHARLRLVRTTALYFSLLHTLHNLTASNIPQCIYDRIYLHMKKYTLILTPQHITVYSVIAPYPTQ